VITCRSILLRHINFSKLWRKSKHAFFVQ